MQHGQAAVLDAHIFAANRAVGMISLAVDVARGATRRKRVEEAGSLRVRFPSSPGELEAVIVNTAGGIASGDRLDAAVDVGPNASLLVTTAAAEKVYRSLGPHAQVAVRLTLNAGSTLCWLPQEMILFDRARLRRSIEVDMAENARLVLAEMLIFGRSAMGERLEEGSLLDAWRVRRERRLIFAETLRLDGSIAEKLDQPASANGAVAVATVLLAPGSDGLAAVLRETAPSLQGEVSASAWNGIVVARFLGTDGAVVRHDVARLLACLGIGAPRLWSN